MSEVLFECRGISKAFGATKALTDVSISIQRGEVHGLIGENGSGKSTLSSIIAGIRPADVGEMWLKGTPHTPTSIVDAENSGVAMVVQEQGTVNDISVAANLFLGSESRFAKLGFISIKKMEAAAQAALADLDITSIAASAIINGYSFEDRKLVEIARAMSTNPDLLIIDETTTALAVGGRVVIKRILERMRNSGRSVLFISHDLDELLDVCNRMTVLRDGVVVGTFPREELTVPRLQELMVGRDVGENYYRNDYEAYAPGDTAVQVKHISTGTLLTDVSFDLHYGEILGISGLSDCGIHDIGKVMYGLMKPITGSVRLVCADCVVRSSGDALKHHVAYIPKNRDTESLILCASISDNIAVAGLSKLEKRYLISKHGLHCYAKRIADDISVKYRDVDQDVVELSGGNKQKVVFAKWMANDSEIFILDCPTRGVDVGVKAAMYDLMDQLRRDGKAVLLISEELPELIGMSDRLIVFKDGRAQKEFRRSPDLTENEVIRYMI